MKGNKNDIEPEGTKSLYIILVNFGKRSPSKLVTKSVPTIKAKSARENTLNINITKSRIFKDLRGNGL